MWEHATMRIVQVPLRYHPVTGGIETHTSLLCKGLRDAGHDVVVITGEDRARAPKRSLEAGVSVERSRTWLPSNDWNLAPGVFTAVRRSRPDLVHVQGIHSFVPIFAMLGAISIRRPFVLTFHTGGHASSRRHRLRNLQWTLLGPLMRRANALIAVSQHEVDLFSEVLKIPRESILLIRNGVTPPEAGSAERNERFTVLSVGRLVRYKGHDRAIAAMPALLEARPDARLVVVGDGPERAALEEQVRTLGLGESVSFAFFPPDQRPALNALVQNAHVVALLSEYEAHPIAVIEALSLGTPVLALYNSGFKELADAGMISALPDDASSEDVARALLTALDGPPTSVAMPTWAEMVDSVTAVYERVGTAGSPLSASTSDA